MKNVKNKTKHIAWILVVILTISCFGNAFGTLNVSAFYTPIYGNNVYRVYNPNSGEHHYTFDFGEVKYLHSLGWNYENTAWCVNDECTKDVYRLYNPNATGIYEVGAHHYTADEGEKDWLVGLGWQYEGVGWKVIE